MLRRVIDRWKGSISDKQGSGKLSIVCPGHCVSSGTNEKSILRLETQHDSKKHKVVQVMLMENNITCFGGCVHHGGETVDALNRRRFQVVETYI
jgi:hypothetical protein